MKYQNAKGIKGYLIFDHSAREVHFRVYNRESPDGFDDYEIRINDLDVIITDPHAELIKDEAGEAYYLDHSRDVLGKEE